MRTIAAFLALGACALAAPVAPHRLTPEQALNLRRITDLRFSPSGARLAFVVGEPVHGTDNYRHIWMLDVATHHSRQYSFSSKSEDTPRWSPDGSSLALLSDRDGNRQIYLMPTAGGDAYPVTSGKRNVSAFAWSPDGRQIAFLAPDVPTSAETKKAEDKDDAIVVDHEHKSARVWLLDVTSNDVASKKARPLTGTNWEVRELLWQPSGAGLILAATNRPASDDNTVGIYRLPLTGGAPQLLFQPAGPMGDVHVSPDGKQLAYLASPDGGPEPHDVFVRALDAPPGQPSQDLTAESLDRAMRAIAWMRDGSLVALAQQGFGSALYRIQTSGSAAPIAEATPNPGSYAIAPNGDIAFVGQSGTRPPEVYLASPHDAPARITEVNSSWDTVQLAHPQPFHYATFDGLQIEGRWLKPLGAEGNGPFPLVVLVHGGPTGAWSDSIEMWGQLLAAHGFAAAYFNIRGSTGYGAQFMESNRADWGGADFKDVMAGVDYLVKQGIADPNRLGIGGWSYGGYMSEWAITQTNRFKAAVSGAGMVDLIAEFDTENGPSYDKWFWGLPYDKPQPMIEHSPFMFLKNAHTPILILQGIADTTDPLGQSTGLYRGLKFYGAPAELVEYPRENHGFHEQQHQIDRLNRIVAWYEKYLVR